MVRLSGFCPNPTITLPRLSARRPELRDCGEWRIGNAAARARSSAPTPALAFLWGLEGLGAAPPSVIDITVPMGVTRPSRLARVHHTRRPAARGVWRLLIPTTPVARTLVDLADVLEEEALLVALDSARRRRAPLLYLALLLDPQRLLALY